MMPEQRDLATKLRAKGQSLSKIKTPLRDQAALPRFHHSNPWRKAQRTKSLMEIRKRHAPSVKSISCHFWGHITYLADGHTITFRNIPKVTIAKFVFDAPAFVKATAKAIPDDVEFTLNELIQTAKRLGWSDVLAAIGPMEAGQLSTELKRIKRQWFDGCRILKIGTSHGLSLWKVYRRLG